MKKTYVGIADNNYVHGPWSQKDVNEVLETWRGTITIYEITPKYKIVPANKVEKL